ncbi:MAG TPA: hypothetical protein V6D03_04705 [Candidatus Caenarcaniphilales bacterium]
MKFEVKKPYTSPQLIVHGPMEKITQAGALLNSDVPMGAAASAFSPV